MRTTLWMLTLAVILGGLGQGTAAAGPGQISDAAGDANGINGQWYSAAMLGYITEEVRDTVFAGDPFDEGVSGPASYAPGDLRSVRFETESAAVPVGLDGLDYRATGLLIRITTEEPLVAPPGTGFISLNVIAEAGPPANPNAAADCRTSFSVRADESGRLERVGWYRFEDCAGGMANMVDAAWTASRSADGREITLRYPFASLDAAGRHYLKAGGIIFGPHVAAQLRGLSTIDVTVRGQDFEIGADLPGDVPCTSDCPSG